MRSRGGGENTFSRRMLMRHVGHCTTRKGNEMYYSKIQYCDIANGTGVRTTLFVSGCRNHCKGCFQPETWDFHYGKPFTQEVAEEIIQQSQHDYIAGLTLLGGDPFEEENQEGLSSFTSLWKHHFPKKTIWAYTGYLFEDLLPNGKKHTVFTDGLLSNIDVLVDGPFVEEKKNMMLKFRGSENQRMIDMETYRQTGEIVTL